MNPSPKILPHQKLWMMEMYQLWRRSTTIPPQPNAKSMACHLQVNFKVLHQDRKIRDLKAPKEAQIFKELVIRYRGITQAKHSPCTTEPKAVLVWKFSWSRRGCPTKSPPKNIIFYQMIYKCNSKCRMGRRRCRRCQPNTAHQDLGNWIVEGISPQ